LRSTHHKAATHGAKIFAPFQRPDRALWVLRCAARKTTLHTTISEKVVQLSRFDQ
jgi:hypothetical protein